MPSNSTFSSWLGTLLGHSEREINDLLDDESALQFLITWSIFESKCFHGRLKVGSIKYYADATAPSINSSALQDDAEYFHSRYQNGIFFKNLIHESSIDSGMPALIKKSFTELSTADKLFFLVFVVYRYRNNIFHGNKGVQSWLQYRDQIRRCTQVMQALVTHAERSAPTMKSDIYC